MTEFRTHLMSTFDQACLAVSRKLFSLEQFAKFVKARAQLTQEYARSLEKLSQKSPSFLYFEESGVSKIWNQIILMEAETARVHNNLAQALQKQVYDQLMFIREATEKSRKSIVTDGQSYLKELQDSLLFMNKAKETYHKACRDLEVAEYLKKEEAGQTSAQNQAKREKKVAKCHTEVSEAETAYRNAIEETKCIQRRYYDERLPSLLDSLQVVYFQRLTKIQECLEAYASEVSQVASSMSPVAIDSETVCKGFVPQAEIEEYIAKTESFFRMPADPVFEQFIRTPEGQVPAALSMQQKLASRFHIRKGEKGATDAKESAASNTGAVAYAAPTGLLGMTPEEMMEAQKSRFPALKVPYVLVFLADCILKFGGPTADGIFRLSGSLVAMESVKARLNKSEYVPPNNVHDSSALFKFVLRSFPESLVPNNLYEEAIAEPPTSFDVFNKIPEPSRTVAGFVIRYLREYYLTPESIKATQMTLDNIATVFFPCFMKNPSNDLQEIMKHMDQEKTWVKKCLSGLDVSQFPSLDECLAVSAPAQITVPGNSPVASKPNEETAAAQRAKALPAKPQGIPAKPQHLPPTPTAKLPDLPTQANTQIHPAEDDPKLVESPKTEQPPPESSEEKPPERRDPPPMLPPEASQQPAPGAGDSVSLDFGSPSNGFSAFGMLDNSVYNSSGAVLQAEDDVHY